MKKKISLFIVAVLLLNSLVSCSSHELTGFVLSDITTASTENNDSLSTVDPEAPEDAMPSDYLEFASSASANTADDRLTLAFKTDSHFTEGDSVDGFLKFAKIQQYVPIDLYVHGGDLINGNHPTKEIAVNSLTTAIDSMRSVQSVPFISIKGNHDDNTWPSYDATGERYNVFPKDSVISSKEWRDIAFTISPEIVIDDTGSYGYMDHEGSKIRVLFVDTSDLPYEADENGIYYYGAYTAHGIRNDQLNFMAEAMTFADKGEDGKNWAILVMSHVPIETMKNNGGYRFGGADAIGRNFYVFLRIIEAYKNGTAISESKNSTTNYGDGGYDTGDKAEDFAYSISADYSKNGPGEVIGFICGHTHTDNYSSVVGTGSYDRIQLGIYPELSLGYSYISVGPNGFAVITVDRNGDGTGNIHVDKYGLSVVTNESLISSGDNAMVSTDPIVTELVTSEPASGSIASGHYTIAYSQPPKKS